MGDGDRRPQHVDQLHGRHVGVEQLAGLVAVPGDGVRDRPLAQLEPARARLVHHAAQPALRPPAERLAAPLARPGGAGAVDHGRELVRAPPHVRLAERDARPGAHGAAEDLLRGREENDGLAPRPSIRCAPPLRLGELDEAVETPRRHELQEHPLAVPVCPAVEHGHAALVLQQRERRGRQSPAPRQPAVGVEDGGCLGSRHANRRLEHQPRRERVGAEALGAAADELVALAQQREGAVGRWIAWNRHCSQSRSPSAARFPSRRAPRDCNRPLASVYSTSSTSRSFEPGARMAASVPRALNPDPRIQ